MGELIISILILVFLILLAKTRDKEKVKTKIDYYMLTRVVAYFREHNLSLGFLITWFFVYNEEGRAFPVAEADLIAATERDRHCIDGLARTASGQHV